MKIALIILAVIFGLAIIGAIATVVFVVLTDDISNANDAEKMDDLRSIQVALDESYRANGGSYEALGSAVDVPSATTSACAELNDASLVGVEVRKILPIIPRDPGNGTNYYIEVDANTPTQYRIIAHLDKAENRLTNHIATNVGTDLGVALGAQATGECDCNLPTRYCVGSIGSGANV